MSFGTRAVHSHPIDAPTGGVNPVINLSTTFAQIEPGKNLGFEYARSGNPTRKTWENAIAKVEGAKYGLAFASGLATNTTIMHMLKAGDHVVSMDDVYGGTHRYFAAVFNHLGVEFTFADMSVEGKLEAALKPNTRLVWVETPTNPLLKIADIRKIAAVTKARGITLVVDSTFCTPYIQRPLELGADIVVHSVTKYIAGHCDVVGGVLVTNNDALFERLSYLQNAVGAVPSPHDCYAAIRGMKTLHLRMERHEQNARRIAAELVKSDQLEKVVYPGLASHPQHELAKQQMHGFGGIISIHIKGGQEAGVVFLKALKVFTMAVSLGGVESLAQMPSAMTHGAVPEEHRLKIGLTGALIRLSVGIEDADDLVADLRQALDKVREHNARGGRARL